MPPLSPVTVIRFIGKDGESFVRPIADKPPQE
jgi:hypothetical protein